MNLLFILSFVLFSVTTISSLKNNIKPQYVINIYMHIRNFLDHFNLYFDLIQKLTCLLKFNSSNFEYAL